MYLEQFTTRQCHSLLPLLFCWACLLATRVVDAEERPYITTATPITLLSANDGELLELVEPDIDFKPADSITVIHLGPDHRPIVKTVYGTVPNTIAGPPHMAVAGKGRYGFVTNHSLGMTGTGMTGAESLDAAKTKEAEPNIVSVIDLASPDLKVVQRVELPPYPVMAKSHPDGNRVLVGGGSRIHVLEIVGGPKVVKTRTYLIPVFVSGFDISPSGQKILVTGVRKPKDHGNPFVDWLIQPHLLEWNGDRIEYRGPVGFGKFENPFNGAFSPRIGPFGKRAIVLNGLGLSPRGKLDDALIIDMASPEPSVSHIVKQVADGLESLAFHPSGEWAVICCLDGGRHATTSHLAVVEIDSLTPRIICHLPVEVVPEGIEFSPDGRQLFIGCTGSHHIAVYDVVGPMRLRRSGRVIHTGQCPSSLAVSQR